MDDDDAEIERARFSKFQHKFARPHASITRQRPTPRRLVPARARANVKEEASVRQKAGTTGKDEHKELDVVSAEKGGKISIPDQIKEVLTSTRAIETNERSSAGKKLTERFIGSQTPERTGIKERGGSRNVPRKSERSESLEMAGRIEEVLAQELKVQELRSGNIEEDIREVSSREESSSRDISREVEIALATAITVNLFLKSFTSSRRTVAPKGKAKGPTGGGPSGAKKSRARRSSGGSRKVLLERARQEGQRKSAVKEAGRITKPRRPVGGRNVRPTGGGGGGFQFNAQQRFKQLLK